MHIDRMKREEFLERKSKERVEYKSSYPSLGSRAVSAGSVEQVFMTAKSATNRRKAKISLAKLSFMDGDK